MPGGGDPFLISARLKHPLNVGADKIPTDMPFVVEAWLKDVQDQFTFEMG